MTPAGRVLAGVAGLAGLTGVLYAFGGMPGLVVLAGVLILCAIVLWPVTGVALLIITGTALQVLGSRELTGLPFSLSKILGLVTLAGWIIWVLRLRRPAITLTPQLKPLAAFAAVVVLSTLIMPDLEYSVIGVFRLVQLLLLYFLLMNVAIDRRTLVRMCGVLTLAATLSCLIGFAEYFLPAFELMWDDPRLTQDGGTIGAVVEPDVVSSGPIKRITGGVGNPNWFAYLLAAALPLNLFWWRSTRDPGLRMVVIGLTGVHLLALALSYTRAGVLGVAAAVLYLLARRRLPVAPVAAIALFGILTAFAWSPPGFIERTLSLSFLQGGSTPVRTHLLNSAWDMVKDGWLLGYGHGQFGPELMRRLRFRDDELEANTIAEFLLQVEEGREDVHNIATHNLFFEVAVEHGLLGLVPFLVFLARVVGDLSSVERRGTSELSELAACLKAGVLAFYVCAFFGHVFTMKMLWILAGLAAALRRVAFTRPATPTPTAVPGLSGR